MKRMTLGVLFASLLVFAATPNPSHKKPESSSGFCGRSTLGACQSDSDCIPQGCSHQICQSKKEEAPITTCEWKDCYAADLFSLQCGCVKTQCRWH